MLNYLNELGKLSEGSGSRSKNLPCIFTYIISVCHFSSGNFA